MPVIAKEPLLVAEAELPRHVPELPMVADFGTQSVGHMGQVLAGSRLWVLQHVRPQAINPLERLVP